MEKDYYAILGVPRDADADRIKRAYRRLAMEHHPDRNDNPEAEERFKVVTEAYEVLRDEEKRRLYDRYGEAGLRRGGGAGFEGFGFADAFEIFMREFGGGAFGDLFGGASASRGPRRGRSVRVDVKVSLEEAARGTARTIRVKVLEACETCGGSGAEPGTSRRRCATCGGAGEVRQVQRSILGQFVSVRPCPQCGGEGSRLERPCGRCRGAGRVRREKRIKLDVPAGVSTDDVLKLRRQGNVGPDGGPRGDLVVQVEVEEDARFERRGDDLVLNLPITFSQAALGAELEVETIHGSTSLKVPAGIQSGQVLRLRGMGMPRLRGDGRGDLLVRVLVWTPTKLSVEQRAVVERLAALEETPPEPDRHEPGFWERVKSAFTG
ncbi:MAG: molecular chaperone DnaJ [Gemmatimonadota bacterium]